MGRKCFTWDAPAFFSSAWITPVTKESGHGCPFSIQWKRSAIDWRRSGAILSMSCLLHPSGPVAAVDFLLLITCRIWSAVMRSYFMGSCAGMAMSMNSSNGSQNASGVCLCLSQRVAQSSPKRSNRLVRSPIWVSWVTSSPGWRLLRFSTHTLSSSTTMAFMGPCGVKSGFSGSKWAGTSKQKACSSGSTAVTVVVEISVSIWIGGTCGFCISLKTLLGLSSWDARALAFSSLIKTSSSARTSVSKVWQSRAAWSAGKGLLGRSYGTPGYLCGRHAHHSWKPFGKPGAFKMAPHSLVTWIILFGERLWLAWVLLANASNLLNC